MAITQKYTANGLAAGLAVAALHFAMPAAAFSVDGKLTNPNEYMCANYCVSYDVDLKVTGTPGYPGHVMHDGWLNIGRDGPSGDVFVMFEMPTAIVDNVYRPSGNAPEYWSPHTFSHLLEYDKLKFKVDGKFVKLDYLQNYSNPTRYEAQIERDDYNIVEDVASSLEYNLANGLGDNSSSEDAEGNALWEQSVIYEFRLDGDQFADGTVGDDPGDVIGQASFSHVWVNAWTNKPEGDDWIDAWCLWDPYDNAKCNVKNPPPTTAVSEPASGALMLLGLTAVSLYRRRRAVK